VGTAAAVSDPGAAIAAVLSAGRSRLTCCSVLLTTEACEPTEAARRSATVKAAFMEEARMPKEGVTLGEPQILMMGCV